MELKLLYLKEKIDLETPIGHYMHLSYFEKMLSSRKFYIKRRRCFPDKTEVQPSPKKVFEMLPVSTAGKSLDNGIRQENYEQLGKFISMLEVVRDIPASCWTLGHCENYLMWKAYTQKRLSDEEKDKHNLNDGVLILSSINDFAASVDSEDREIICGKMSYNDFHNMKVIGNQMFSKSRAYSDEKEFRFYFPKANGDDEKDMKDDYIELNVDLSTLIHTVILSPFMSREKVEDWKKKLKLDYNLVVKESAIKENINN